MPKTPSVILREKLAKHSIELLDIYRFKNYDLIRVKRVSDGKVFLVKSERHVSDLTGVDDVKNMVKKILEDIEKQSKESK